MKRLLVVVDMQNDFIDGALGTKEAQAIVPAVVKKAEAYAASGTRCIHAGHPFRRLFGYGGGQKASGSPLYQGHRRVGALRSVKSL